MTDSKQIKKVFLPVFSNFVIFVLSLLNYLLVFLQLRKKMRYWGVIYDSVTKQPLDPVKVSIVYEDNNKIENTCLTDLEGHYGFLARPGTFKILAYKTNYIFPSTVVKGDQDGIYKDLYHGEFFNVTGESEVVAPNIPMDPIGTDWNQSAKRHIVNKKVYLSLFFERLTAIFFWFGFILTGMVFVLNKFENFHLKLILSVYLFLFIFEILLPRQRLWGKVTNKKTGLPVSGVELKLLMNKIPGVVLGRAISRDDGRFLLRANPGKYILQITDVSTGIEIGTLPIKIPIDRVLNKNIQIKL